jgi:hypothetical protein
MPMMAQHIIIIFILVFNYPKKLYYFDIIISCVTNENLRSTFFYVLMLCHCHYS